MERRLAAILAADVVGYSRLVRTDEAGTLATVKAHREDLIEPKVLEHKGRIVKLMGDGLLIEFPSAVEAVQCAVEVQHLIGEQNRGVPEDRQVTYRIGINVGDIVVDGDDILGDGANMAARLEGLADPGGICVARNVFDQVDGKLDLGIEYLGDREVKNIAKPVSVFGVVLDDKATALVSPVSRVADRPARHARLAAGAVALAMALAATLWWQPWRAGLDTADGDAAELSLPGKPSIAVLAFDNLSGDPARDYLSDGLAENIITELSRFPDFFVIARNSTFTYKGKPVKVQQVARELGVRYVVDGSIQTAGENLRVTAQLIDATSGKHLWGERYDRDLQDMFAIQDEITRTVAATLKENIDLAEFDRLKRRPTESLDAYELRKRAQEQGLTFTREGNIRARQLAEEAIALDPNYAGAYVELAWAHIFGFRFGWSETLSREESLARAFRMARKAVELDPFDFKGYWVLANATTQSGDLGKAAALYDRALALNPNSASVLADSIDPLVYGGRAAEAVARMKAAIRLNPHHPDWYLWNLGWAQYFAGEYEDALASIERMSAVPDRLRRTLAPILLRLGREEQARAVIRAFLADNPDYSIEEAAMAPFEHEAYRKRWLDDLRELGVPEKAS